MTSYLSRALAATAKTRRCTFALGLCAAILAASPAFASRLGMVAPDQWQPHANVGILDHVTLRIHWHDSIKLLREAAIEHDVERRRPPRLLDSSPQYRDRRLGLRPVRGEDARRARGQ